MTETEWRECDHPEAMLNAVAGRASDRKLRLFAVACCRRLNHLLKESSRSALIVAERFAEADASAEALEEAHREAYRIRPLFADASWAVVRALAPVALDAAYEASAEAARSVASIASTSARGAAMAAVVTGARPGDRSDAWSEYESAAASARAAEYRQQAALLRDLLGDPFRPARFDPEWSASGGGTVRRIAEAVFAERAYDRLPILADALEDVGCAEAAILDHCRGPNTHVRGCWVVDQILGRT
jgi:hypothetical protein